MFIAMKTFGIVAVFALLFPTNNADSKCESQLEAIILSLAETQENLKIAKAELKKVQDELKNEKNKCLPNVQPTPGKPKYPVEFWCTFENISACNMTQKPHSDAAEWIIGHGVTDQNTGPSADHTLKTSRGHYMYLSGLHEAFKMENVMEILKTATVEFPAITPSKTSEFCVSFWYYMYGKDVRTLRFKSNEKGTVETVFELKGDQGQKWRYASYNVSERKDNFSFSFEATTLAYLETDYVKNMRIPHNVECNIAIDDIQVRAIPCSKMPVPTEKSIIG